MTPFVHTIGRYTVVPERNVSTDPDETQHVAATRETATTWAVYREALDCNGFVIEGEGELVHDSKWEVAALLHAVDLHMREVG